MKPAGVRLWGLLVTILIVNLLCILWLGRESAPAIGVRLVPALPAGEMDDADHFSLLLDEPPGVAVETGEVLAAPPFEIEPAVAGSWVWGGPRRIDFRFDEPLPPGREFVLTPAADFERIVGRPCVAEEKISFRTRALRLLAATVASCDRRDVNFDLEFNQPVHPDALRRHLKVRGKYDPREITPRVLSRTAGSRLTVRTRRPRDGKLVIFIRSGLCGDGAVRGITEAVEREMVVPDHFAMLRARPHAPGTARDVTVRVDFSAPVSVGKAEFDVEPAVTKMTSRVSGSSVYVTGAFQPGTSYTITPKGILSRNGATLTGQQRLSFLVPDRNPTIRFRHHRGILTPRGNLTVDLDVTNVSTLTLTARRVYDNKIVEELERSRSSRTREDARRTVKLDGAHNELQPAVLDLRDLVAAPLGVYRIGASANGRRWVGDSMVVTVTDLGITAKRERDAVFLWVTSLRTARPVEGVTVEARSRSDQVLASGKTREDGTVRLPVPRNHPDGAPFVAIATLEDDLAYARIDGRRWDLADADVGGRSHPDTYDVMLYAERGVYRPGERVHLTGIVRDAGGRTPPPFPLSVNVHRPGGRVVARFPVEHGAQGVFHVDYIAEADAPTGRYRFTTTLPGGHVVLGQTRALLEAFVPLRIEVAATPAAEVFRRGEPVAVEVEGAYIFGNPAGGLPATVTGTLRRELFRSGVLGDHVFGRRESPVKLPESTVVLDDHGRGTLELELPEGLEPGLWRADLTVTVTELGGRSVTTQVAVPVDAAARYVGARLPFERFAPVSEAFSVDWALRTFSDEPAAPGPIRATLARVAYESVLEEVNGVPRWQSSERLFDEREVHIAARSSAGVLDLTCDDAGYYRLTLADLESGHTTESSFFASRSGDSRQSVALTRPRLELVLDRERYDFGDEARVLVRSPFPGTLFLTLESTRVRHHWVVPMKENGVELRVPVEEGLRGGGFVSGTVVRAVDPDDEKWLPHRAFGTTRLAIEDNACRLPVEIEAPERAAPGETITVRAQAATPQDPDNPGIVHLWAVDDGILQLTGFAVPDPHQHYLGARRLEVRSTDTYSQLLPDHRRPGDLTKIGGDGGPEAGAMRRSLIPIEARESAVIWRRAVPLSAAGSARFDVTLPDVSGRLRFMAVSAAGDAYGSASRAVTVTSPVLIESSWPRFAAPGDRFDVPVKIFNNTEETVDVTVAAVVRGPLELEPLESNHIAVAPASSGVLWLVAKAVALGQVTIDLDGAATIAGHEAPSLFGREHRLLTVRPPATLHKERLLYRRRAGESLDIPVPEEFLPGAVETTVSVGARPTVQLLPALNQVLDYPYGCVEQTTSQLFTLLYVPDLARDILDRDGLDTAVREMVNAGIARLWSMQWPSGGLGYWPGKPPQVWGTAVAGSFLAAAKRAGYDLDEEFIGSLLDYLDAALAEPDLDPNVAAMVCYVLASFDAPRRGWMAKLAENSRVLDVGGCAHLARAYLAIGRRDRALRCIPEDVLRDGEAPVSRGHRITSTTQQEALLLLAMLELEPRHAIVGELVRRLEGRRADNGGLWRNTHENGIAVCAVSRYLATLGAGEGVRGALTSAGDSVRFDEETAAELVVSGAPVRVSSDGDGDVYVTVVHEGLLSEPQRDYDRHIQVRRRWLDESGEPLALDELRVGDRIHVEVTLEGNQESIGRDRRYIAVVDTLPAGVEVENPRLDATADRGSARRRVEFLDDRVIVFSKAGPSPRTFRYSLRVVTAGSFVLPPIHASSMYDAEVASLHGGGRIEVER